MSVQIVGERGYRHDLTRAGDVPVFCGWRGKYEGSEGDLRRFLIRCAKSATADDARAGVILAGIDETAAGGVGTIEIESSNLEFFGRRYLDAPFRAVWACIGVGIWLALNVAFVVVRLWPELQ